MSTPSNTIQPIRWTNNKLELLDQRLLPAQEQYLVYDDVNAVADAIRDMVVRGAPAIGITAAYGVVLAARARFGRSLSDWKQQIEFDFEVLSQARPTAVNLFWAIERMRKVIADLDFDGKRGRRD